jgi:hypothetical protein
MKAFELDQLVRGIKEESLGESLAFRLRRIARLSMVNMNTYPLTAALYEHALKGDGTLSKDTVLFIAPLQIALLSASALWSGSGGALLLTV